MNGSDLLRKLNEGRPKLAEHIQHWGLPKEQLFPLDTVDLVKHASAAFDDQVERMTPAQRLVCARNIHARAGELGVRGLEKGAAFKYAHAHLSPHFTTFLALRKHASANVANDELDKLASAAGLIETRSDDNDRVQGLDKVASALEDFDRRHGLVGEWGHTFPDPSYSTFTPVLASDEDLEPTVKVAGFEVRESDFDDADWSRLDGKLPDEVVNGVKDADNKLAVFASLPAPEKEIVYQSLFAG